MISRLVIVLALGACGGRPDPNCNPYACYDATRTIEVTTAPDPAAPRCLDTYFVDLVATTWKRTLCAHDTPAQQRDGKLDAAQLAAIRTQFLAIHDGREGCSATTDTQRLRITKRDGSIVDGYSQSCRHEKRIDFAALQGAMFALAK